MGMGMGKTPTVEVDPVVEEEAAAVGDPHLTQSNGVMSDLQPEDLSLVDSLGMGMGGKPPSIEVDPIIEEEAAAVGDPHLALSNGAKEDLCCEGGHCQPCE